MSLKPLALVLELTALVLLVSGFAAEPFRWGVIAGGVVLFAAGFAIRKRHDQA